MFTKYKRLVLVKEELEKLYRGFNNRKFVHPDPLEFLYEYEDLREREIVGLLASSLAYGRVSQILLSVSSVLGKMKPSPFVFLMESSLLVLEKTFSDFRYRFTSGRDLSNLLFNIKNIIEEYGSLELCFMEGFKESDETVIPALVNFSEKLCSYCYNSLIPLSGGGSAFKRLNLFLRWMVRKDNVDPGGWNRIPPSKLVVPLDTHMYRICLAAGFTQRKMIDIQAALEVTASFKKIEPDDPVKYDFALTRTAILGNFASAF